MLRGIVVLVFGMLLAGQAKADAVQPLNGVWAGTVGSLPVNVCLQVQDDASLNFGAYYYLSHLKLINLQPGDKGAWTEGSDASKPDAVWTLKMGGGDTVSGSWAGNGKTLDVNLHRLAKLSGDDADGPCGTSAFFDPRVTLPKIRETAAKLDGQAYTQLDIDAGKQFDVSFQTFRLAGSGDAIDKLNKIFMPAGGKDYVECLQGAAAMGNDGDYEVTTQPEVLTAHWLVVSTGDGSSCGGAHPVNSSNETVYDLQSGDVVDVGKWLASTAAKDGTPKGKLAQLVNAAYAEGRKGDQDCLDAEKDAEDWNVSLTHKGMSFTPDLPYVANACADPTEISFDKMTPFLTPEGKKQLTTFRGELH